jgi:hypothetical protein
MATSIFSRAGLATSLAVVTALALVAVTALPASAYWSFLGTGLAVSTTATLTAPVGVTVPATVAAGALGADVPVSFSAGPGGLTPAGFIVTRSDGTSTSAACDTSASSLATTPSCVDEGVPAGNHVYTVTAVYGTWTAISTPSGTATVTAPHAILGAAASYSVLGGTAVTGNAATRASGDLGVSPGIAVTGIDAALIGGDIHAGDSHAANAQTALADAYDDLSDLTVTRPPLAGDLIGRTLTPGVYHSTAALDQTGVLTFDAGGASDAVFIIRVDAALNTAAASRIELINEAQAANIYWVVLGAVGTGANSTFSGTILTRGAITLGAGTQLIGRALSRDAITLAGNSIRFTEAPAPTMTIDNGATHTARDATVTITGTSSAPINSPVRVTVDGQVLTTEVTSAATWSVTTAALTAGTRTVVAKVRDPAGNGATATQELTVELNPSPVALGSAATFSVLAGTSVVNTGTSTLSGNLGISPATAVSGFEPGTYAGTLHAGDGIASAARSALDAAITDASGRASHTVFTGDLTGRTFNRGVHHTSAAFALTGTLTLDARGDPNAVFIFQAGAAFNTAAASAVTLVNGAQASNVFWVVKDAAVLGANSTFAGNLMAGGAITIGEAATVRGQVLTPASVTLANNAFTGIVGAQ